MTEMIWAGGLGLPERDEILVVTRKGVQMVLRVASVDPVPGGGWTIATEPIEDAA